MCHKGQPRQAFSPLTISKTADSQACNRLPEHRSELQGSPVPLGSDKEAYLYDTARFVRETTGPPEVETQNNS